MRQISSQRRSDPLEVIPPSDPKNSKRIEAFPAAVRAKIEPLVHSSSRLSDLAESFPALLFALATDYGDPADRASARAAVEDGLSLKEAAARLGLPMWLRKLPAAALQSPLSAVPMDAGIVNRLVSLLPAQPKATAAWLERVMTAHGTGCPELTLWVAQQFRSVRPSASSSAFLTTLAWAWYSLDNTDTRAGNLIAEPWKPTLGGARAITLANLWRERIALDVCLGPGIADPWVAEGEASGFNFIALRTADDFIAEASRMNNCLDRYADRLRGRAVRVFSIREGSRSVADMEISPHEREPGHPVISQLRGPHNRRASLEVWRAAYQWLGSQPMRLADKSIVIKPGPAVLRRRQDEIWRPFIAMLQPRLVAAFETAVLSRKAKRASALSSPLAASPRLREAA